MGDKQYDVPENILKSFHLKQKQRAEHKAYFMRYVANPHRPIDVGALFDPVIHRFLTLTSYQIEHYKPTPKSLKFPFFCFFIPCVVAFYVFTWEINNRRQNISNGLVAYADRKYKLVN